MKLMSNENIANKQKWNATNLAIIVSGRGKKKKKRPFNKRKQVSTIRQNICDVNKR